MPDTVKTIEALKDLLRQAVEMLRYLNESDDYDANNLIFCIEEELKESNNE